MIYKAYLIQSEGCDYTIGCGNVIINLSSNNLVDAKKELEEIIYEKYSINEREIEHAYLYEINNVIPIGVKEITDRKNQHIKETNEFLIRNKELAELQRLKNKYEH